MSLQTWEDTADLQDAFLEALAAERERLGLPPLPDPDETPQPPAE